MHQEINCKCYPFRRKWNW